MSASSIEWTDETWNPVAGCSIVSPGCHHCYAMQMARRLEAMGQEKYSGLTKTAKTAGGRALWTGKINLVPEAMALPLSWKKPRMVFVNSMSDLFHEDVPVEFIADVLRIMRAAHKHTFQVLTKRAQRMFEVVSQFRPCEHGWVTHNGNNPKGYGGDGIIVGDNPCRKLDGSGMDAGNWPLFNVWLGVSAEDQQRADERLPWLLKTPAAVRFVSAEPLLGPIDFSRWLQFQGPGWRYADPDDTTGRPGLDWVIVGGESGPGARPMHPDWARSIRDQCQAAGVPFFFKQWGEWQPWHELDYPPGPPAELFERSTPYWPDGTIGPGQAADNGGPGHHLIRVGKKEAGRLLDGRTWDEFPAVP